MRISWLPVGQSLMIDLGLVSANLTHPAVLAFGLGVIAAVVRSDLALPPAAAKLLSSYLLLAIGLKGGVALSTADPRDLIAPALATLVLGVITPVGAFVVLRRLGRFSLEDAAGIAAHYGSVSAVTFAAAIAFATTAGSAPEAFLPALVALLEVPGILIALAIAARTRQGTPLGAAVREVLGGQSIMLLMGGIAIGAITGPAGMEHVAPVFVVPFAGALVFFLLHLGTVAGARIADLRSAGPFLAGFPLVMPLVAGAIGTLAGIAAGLGVGGAAVLGAMAASASYIAAPAAVQVSLPEANLSYALTASLAVTFPFNLAVGIPLFHALAQAVA